MNVFAPVAPAARIGTSESTEPDTAELIAAWPIAPGAMLLLGRAAAALPASGTAQYERRRSDRGPFRTLSWPAGADAADGVLFAAALRLPANTELRVAQTLTFQAQDGAVTLAPLPAEMASPLGFAAEAARLVGGAGEASRANLVRFLSGSFPPAALQRLPVVGAMLAALLADLASRDGCVELMGAVPGTCGFVQGWGGPLRPSAADGAVEVFMVGSRVTRCRGRLASFVRPDIVAPAGGAVLVLPDDASAGLADVDRIYLLGETTLVRRDLVQRRLLGAAESIGHIRDLLPALRCAPATADCLRLALRPRYEGHDTLGAQPLPVRAAIDLALTLPDAGGRPGGVYLAGWMFDPAGHVDTVYLRSSSAPAVWLDLAWTRVLRPDVSDAIAAAGGFPTPSRHDHGFAVFVETAVAAQAEPLHLEIGFQDGTCAFVPVRTQRVDDPPALARAFDGTDLHKPSGIAIVERHLAPLVRALMQRAPEPVAASEDMEPPDWALAIVVPLVGAPVLPRSFLSQFLRDPLAEDEGIVLVCGADWSGGDIAALQRLIGFTGLRARILPAPDAAGALAALEAAAAAMPSTPWLLLADPATAGAAPGWRAALRAAAAEAGTPTVACPTLLYEDFSIRFAGAATFAALPVAPYAAVHRALGGMPAALAGDGAPRPETLGTLACCLLPRAALDAMCGARAGLSTAFGQETAAFLRLQATAIPCLWVPRARLFAPETSAPPCGAVAKLIDGFCLRAAHAAGDFDIAKG